jgi:hypothetical protein
LLRDKDKDVHLFGDATFPFIGARTLDGYLRMVDKNV